MHLDVLTSGRLLFVCTHLIGLVKVYTSEQRITVDSCFGVVDKVLIFEEVLCK